MRWGGVINESLFCQRVNSAKFKVSLLSKFVSNLAEGNHRIYKFIEIHKCKYRHHDKKVKVVELNAKVVIAFLNTNFKDNLIEYKCLCCSENYQKTFDENLEKRFFNIYKLSYHDINKFILLLQKGFCPYECMEDCKKLNQASLPEKAT